MKEIAIKKRSSGNIRNNNLLFEANSLPNFKNLSLVIIFGFYYDMITT
jgi:hypothetical protein